MKRKRGRMYNLKTIELRKQMIDWIVSRGPYEYFITLTFRYDQSDKKCEEQANQLLRFLNRRLFGRKNETDHLDGYVFIEKHSHIRESVHYHFAIKYHQNFDLIGKKHFLQHFYECLRRVKTSDKYNVFGDKTNRIDYIHSANDLFEHLRKKEYLNDEEEELLERLIALRNVTRYDAFCVDRCEVKEVYADRELIKYLTKRFEDDGEDVDFIHELTRDGFRSD